MTVHKRANADGKTPNDLAQEAYEEFIARGGVVQKIPEGHKTDPQELKNQWGRPRKKKPVDPVDKPE